MFYSFNDYIVVSLVAVAVGLTTSVTSPNIGAGLTHFIPLGTLCTRLLFYISAQCEFRFELEKIPCDERPRVLISNIDMRLTLNAARNKYACLFIPAIISILIHECSVCFCIGVLIRNARLYYVDKIII